MLLAREGIGVVEVVERLGGMQAQEPRPPFIGLWSRVEGFGADGRPLELPRRVGLHGAGPVTPG